MAPVNLQVKIGLIMMLAGFKAIFPRVGEVKGAAGDIGLAGGWLAAAAHPLVAAHQGPQYLGARPLQGWRPPPGWIILESIPDFMVPVRGFAPRTC